MIEMSAHFDTNQFGTLSFSIELLSISIEFFVLDFFLSLTYPTILAYRQKEIN